MSKIYQKMMKNVTLALEMHWCSYSISYFHNNITILFSDNLGHHTPNLVINEVAPSVIF